MFTTTPEPSNGPSLTTTLRFALWSYVLLLALPLLLLGIVVNVLARGAVPAARSSDAWFIGSSVFLVVFGTAAMFFRSRLFRPYWRGEFVKPQNYLLGMLSTWIALDAAVLLSLVGCLVSRSLMPGLLPAAIAYVLMMVFWPSGNALARHYGGSDDPEIYKEPA